MQIPKYRVQNLQNTDTALLIIHAWSKLTWSNVILKPGPVYRSIYKPVWLTRSQRGLSNLELFVSRQSSPGSSYHTCITQRRQLDTDLPVSLSKLHEARFVFWHAASKLVFLSIFLPSLSFLVKNSHAFDDCLDLLDFHFGHFEKNTCSLCTSEGLELLVQRSTTSGK